MAVATPAMEDFNVIAAGTPAQVAPVTVDPSQLQQPTAMTGQQQLAGILNKGGALMQQAATAGNQSAASRGLLNSSMGVQAAQGAMIDRAMPLAQGDAAAINAMNSQNASTVNNAITGNADRANRGQEFNATTSNDFNKFNTTNQNAAAQWNAGQQNEAALKTQDINSRENMANSEIALKDREINSREKLANIEATLKTLDINSREKLANIEASYKQLMQVNSSAENMYNQALKNISDIQNNPDVADKGSAINSQLAWMRSGMQMLQNLNGVSGLITF